MRFAQVVGVCAHVLQENASSQSTAQDIMPHRTWLLCGGGKQPPNVSRSSAAKRLTHLVITHGSVREAIVSVVIHSRPLITCTCVSGNKFG